MRHQSLVAFTVAYSVLSLGFMSAIAGEPTMRVRPIRVGDAQVEVVSSESDVKPMKWLLVNLHDDEDTSVEAAKALLPEVPCRLVELKHTGEREVVFGRGGTEYRFDPNRVFTQSGVTATLKKLSEWNAEADADVLQFGQQLIKHYRLNEVTAVVALHNNTEGRYAANNYAPGQEYEVDASAVHLEPETDLDDFYFVTERSYFDALKARGFNVVLQNNEAVTDDGSLSVYCGKLGIAYVNVEAQHGHLQEQIRMLKTLFEVLEELESPAVSAAD